MTRFLIARSLAVVAAAACSSGPDTQPAADVTRGGPTEPPPGSPAGGPVITTPPRTASVGTLPGAVTVGAGGTAGYNIPIQVPPGIAGVEPSLAISYSSAGGNGLLGVGFGLEGLSAITRCPSNLRDDGRVAPIEWHNSDRLCWQGQLLMPVAGVSGHSGAEYRTRRDVNARITQSGDLGAKTSWFRVETADGRVLTYGRADSAKVWARNGTESPTSAAGTIYEWHLDRIEDRHANAAIIEYAFSAQDNGETRVDHRPATIRYTERPGQPPQRGVRFGYERRGDPWAGYLSGAARKQSWRLAQVDTYGPSGAVLSYRFGYHYGSLTGRSLLETVTAVAADGVALPETKFDWQDGEEGVTKQPMDWANEAYSFAGADIRDGNYAPFPGDYARLWGDFSGDGKSDFVTLQRWPDDGQPAEGASIVEGYWLLWENTDAVGSLYNPVNTGIKGTIPVQAEQTELDSPIHAAVIDYDGDGRADILAPHVHEYPAYPSLGGSIDVLQSLGNGFAKHHFDDNDPEHRRFLQVYGLDLNGDGLSDVAYCRETLPYESAQAQWDAEEHDTNFFPWPGQGTWLYALNQPGQGFDLAHAVDTGIGCSVTTATVVLDRDGDGDDDLLIYTQNGIEPTGTYSALDLDLVEHTAGAVNSGLPYDRTQRWCSPTTWGGDGYLVPAWASGLGLDKVFDMNGDGLTDIVRFEHAGGDGSDNLAAIKTCLSSDSNDWHAPWPGRWRVWINTGTTFVAGPTMLETQTYDNLWNTFALAAPVDWNSDGRGDLLTPDPTAEWGEFGLTWKVLVAQPGDSVIVVDTPIPFGNDIGYPVPRGEATPTVDLNGDGLNDVASLAWSSNMWEMFLHKGSVPDLVRGVTNGLGEVTTIAYAPLTDDSVYRDAPDLQIAPYVAYPVSRKPSTRSVVRQLDNDPGIDAAPRTTTYRYFDERIDRLGRGSLGFAERHSQQRLVAEREEQLVVERYEQSTYDPAVRDYPYLGEMIERIAHLITLAPDSDELADAEAYVVHTRTTLQHIVAGATYHAAELSTTSAGHEVSLAAGCGGNYCSTPELLDHVPVTSATATYQIDGFGSVTTATEATAGRHVVTTTEYLNDTTTWRIGRPTLERVVEQRGAHVAFRERAYTYDVYGDVATAIIEPHDDKYKLSTTIWRTAAGNPWVILTTDAVGTMRWIATTYDSEGVFPQSTSNTLGHTQTQTWNRGLGVPLTTEEANGVLQSDVADGFGRRVQRSVSKAGQPVAPPSNIAYERIEVAPGQFRTRVRSWQTGHSDTTVELDRLAREVTTLAKGFDGETFVKDVSYDRLGRLARQYLPTRLGEPAAGFTRYRYDGRGRPLLVTTADQGMTSYLYGGLEQWATDPEGRTRYTQVNALGEIIRTSGGFLDGGDGNNPDDMMCYEYRPFGLLHRTIPCAAIGNGAWTGPQAIITEHDRYGRLETLTDERTGTRQSRYDAFGNLVRTVDAEGQVARFRYDELGRLVRREDAPSGEVTEWGYDVGQKGLLAFTRSPGGNEVRFTYDPFLRPARVERRIAEEEFGVGYQYDDQGRLGVLTYPSPSPVLAPFRVRNQYDDHGHLRAVWNDVTGELYHRADAVNAFGALTDETFGNGAHTTSFFEPLDGRRSASVTLHGNTPLQVHELKWDLMGNLVTRTDHLFGQHEDLRYDRNDRLVESRVVKGDLNQATTFAYDPWGNFTDRSDVGSYAYNHQRLDSAGNATFWYDLNGSLIAQVKDGQATSIAYTPFAKPERITLLPDTTIALEYDADGARVRRVSDVDHSETVYVGDVYERQVVGNTVEHKYRVSGAPGLVAHVTRVFAAPDLWTTETDFVHPDHLGSPGVISDENGGVVSRHAYDAWGQDRDPTNWLALLPAQVSSRVNVGFTGHEAQADAGFIQMRGRHYDPSIGRFISADPIVQAPFDARSLNRYSYVWNNPLTNVDPSGYAAMDAAAAAAPPPPAKPNTKIDAGTFHIIVPRLQTPTKPATTTVESASPASDARAAPSDGWQGDSRIPASWRSSSFDAKAFGERVTAGRDRIGGAVAVGVAQLMAEGVAMEVGLGVVVKGVSAGVKALRAGKAASGARSGRVVRLGDDGDDITSAFYDDLIGSMKPPPPTASNSPGVFRIFRDGDDVIPIAMSHKGAPGLDMVWVHGSHKGFFPTGYDDVMWGAKELADYLRASGWSGNPILLLSCNTGRTATPVARELARELGVIVAAPTHTLGVKAVKGGIEMTTSAKSTRAGMTIWKDVAEASFRFFGP